MHQKENTFLQKKRHGNHSPVCSASGKTAAGAEPGRTPHRAWPGSKVYGKTGPVVSGNPINNMNHNGDDNALRTGTVNFFNEERGYGFVKDNLTCISYFVYRGCLKSAIAANDQVSFEIKKTQGGIIAANVSRIIIPG